MHKKDLKFTLVVELAQQKFTYIYNSSKIAKSRPHNAERPECTSVKSSVFFFFLNNKIVWNSRN